MASALADMERRRQELAGEAAAIEAGANDFEPLTHAQNDDIPEGHSGARFITERTAVHAVATWLKANGWAVIAMAELLSVLPENHPGRDAVLAQYRAHVAGLAATQGRTGLWHQLLDRNDSYLETSASAMFVYSIARGINRGWLDPLAYGPMVSLGWNAVARQVNEQGQVENTCVGTGMAFDPMFYYYRPVSVFAAHGYGPVLLAGAEVLMLRQGKGTAANINVKSGATFAVNASLSPKVWKCSQSGRSAMSRSK